MAKKKERELGKPIQKDKSLIENKKNLHKLYLFVTVVNYYKADEVIKILEGLGVSASFIQVGKGTSRRKVYDVLGIYDDKKGVILSVVKEELRQDIVYTLDEYFRANERNIGITFSVPVASLVGAKMYYFLTNSF